MSKREKETIINFNEEEDVAYIYTCSKSWQKHIEKKLGIKPDSKSAHGRDYTIPKSMIRLPLAKRKLTPEQKAKKAETLKKTLTAIGKRERKSKNRG